MTTTSKSETEYETLLVSWMRRYYFINSSAWFSLCSIQGFLVISLTHVNSTTLSEALSKLALLHLLVVLLEVPMGYLADRFGRKNMAKIGLSLICFANAMLIILLEPKVISYKWTTSALVIVFAVGWTAFSGALKANILAAIARDSNRMLNEFQTNSSFYSNLSILSATVVYPLLANNSIQHVWLASLSIGSISLISIFFTASPNQERFFGHKKKQSQSFRSLVNLVHWQHLGVLLPMFILAIVYAFGSVFESTLQTNSKSHNQVEDFISLANWFLFILGSLFGAKTLQYESKLKNFNLLLHAIFCICLPLVFIPSIYEVHTQRNTLYSLLCFLLGVRISFIQNMSSIHFQKKIAGTTYASTMLSVANATQDLFCSILLYSLSLMTKYKQEKDHFWLSAFILVGVFGFNYLLRANKKE